jgi:hypothetical protein
MISILLIEISRLILTGICLGIGFMLVRMIEDWINGKRLMADEAFMKQVARA